VDVTSMVSDNVVVVTRVRPFNEREKASECIVAMPAPTSTDLVDPKGDGKCRKFNFDHCYWSHDSSQTMATNQQVFNEVGTLVLRNAFDGYNATVFAYGQTGSGKTYTMSGTEGDPGLVPRICKGLFHPGQVMPGVPLGATQSSVMEDQVVDISSERAVTMTIVEVYMEKVYNLLAGHGADCLPKAASKAQETLKVREHPQKGTYIEGLTEHDVSSWKEISDLMKAGNKNRRTAQTKMNSESSRSHSIVMLNLSEQGGAKRQSKICLVDLAGSERPAAASGGNDARFKEGIEINKSLTALGNAIHALADQSRHVPYRDAVLTLLLRESLGGSAKTVMIAALSPASINHDETLSTLRYADRAKQIVNRAKVNEDPTQRLISELRAEIERLKTANQELGGDEEGYEKAPCCSMKAVCCYKKVTCNVM